MLSAGFRVMMWRSVGTASVFDGIHKYARLLFCCKYETSQSRMLDMLDVYQGVMIPSTY